MAGLNARSVLVTGSNRGIGFELVRQLVGKSNRPEWIFATCREPEGPRAQVLKDLAAKHQGVEIIPLDISEPSSVKDAATRVTERLKGVGLTLLINNAGIARVKAMEAETPEDMSEVYKTNVIGPMMVVQAALNMLTRCQSLGYANDKILCIALHPGFVQTDMTGGGLLTVNESVQSILKTLSHLSEKDTGTFVNWQGDVLPW
ncbi:C-signal isoform X4 [Zootoca vivipara]|uniref:C-signal isoform X4 n=1 Tax=Zootoca vivipara TaxID=8524 RepID=UPI00293BA383|nr:C-signal isoform X4 [Zootoca vivipara]